jgi:flagellar biosynthesis protein FlhF
MHTKTYRAANMLTALEEIQTELGPEALIVSVRQVPGGAAWEVWKKPGVEVVAMASAAPVARPVAPTTEEQDLMRRLRGAPTPAAVAPTRTPELKPVDAFTLALRQALGRSPKPPLAAVETAPVALPELSGLDVASDPEEPMGDAESGQAPWSPAVADVYALLIEQGIEESRARYHVDVCLESLTAKALQDPAQVRDFIAHRLEAEISAPGASLLTVAGVVCIIGAPGAGKTTAAAKLAFLAARRLGLRVAWICADTYRAGAIMQARTYAEALRLPLRVVYTAEELAQAVNHEQDADLVIVDLPGVNARRPDQLAELAGLLGSLPEHQTYLAAPATVKPTDLRASFNALGVFSLNGLVLTKLDETASLGSAFNLAASSRLPVLYYSAGPRVLDEFLPAQPARLVRALLDGGW